MFSLCDRLAGDLLNAGNKGTTLSVRCGHNHPGDPAVSNLASCSSLTLVRRSAVLNGNGDDHGPFINGKLSASPLNVA
jgi:hypothetical protein